MLTIPAELYSQICLLGISAYPHEGCGVLIGTSSSGYNRVSAIQPMQNVWPLDHEKSHRFSMDPRAVARLELQLMDEPVDIIGIFHTHPDSQPIASVQDLEWAAWPGYSYLITRVTRSAAGESRSWLLTPERTHFVEEAVCIVE